MSEYQLGVKRDFVARHFLVGGDWGKENELHSHHYLVEVQIDGGQLDPNDFLVDLGEVRAVFDRLVDRYRDSVLNDLPEFAGVNTACERFARILAERFQAELTLDRLTSITAKVWEDESSWASYRLEFE